MNEMPGIFKIIVVPIAGVLLIPCYAAIGIIVAIDKIDEIK